MLTLRVFRLFIIWLFAFLFVTLAKIWQIGNAASLFRAAVTGASLLRNKEPFRPKRGRGVKLPATIKALGWRTLMDKNRLEKNLERAKGFEPSTFSLGQVRTFHVLMLTIYGQLLI